MDAPTSTAIREDVEDVRTCSLTHPSGATGGRWMQEVLFRGVRATHSGRTFAARFFEQLAPGGRPRDREGVDALLEPAVRVATGLLAPIANDPPLVATK